MSPDEKRNSFLRELRLRKDTTLTLQWIAGLAGLALFAAGFAAWFAALSDRASHFCFSILWSLGLFSVGALTGFLFGIPRASQISGDVENTQKKLTRVALTPNTNLEQISDWLTKIIVGIGLVEARGLANGALTLAKLMTECEGGVPCQSLGLAIIITFSVIGFLMGYLATRMFLSPIFNLADGATASFESQAPDVSNFKVDPNNNESNITATDPSVSKQAIAIVNSDYVPSPSDTFKTRYIHAKSLLLTGAFRDAASEYAPLVAERPTDLTLRCEWLWVLYKSNRWWDPEIAGIVKTLDDSRNVADLSIVQEVYLSLTFRYLYAPIQERGAERVLALGTEYEQRKLPPSAGIFINIACANAQLYEQVTQNVEVLDARAIGYEEGAANAIKSALLLEPTAIDRIRQLMEPRSIDNDLSVFAKSKTVLAAVGL